MKKSRGIRLLALLCVAALLGMYAVTVAAAVTASPYSFQLFLGCLVPYPEFPLRSGRTQKRSKILILPFLELLPDGGSSFLCTGHPGCLPAKPTDSPDRQKRQASGLSGSFSPAI